MSETTACTLGFGVVTLMLVAVVVAIINMGGRSARPDYCDQYAAFGQVTVFSGWQHICMVTLPDGRKVPAASIRVIP